MDKDTSTFKDNFTYENDTSTFGVPNTDVPKKLNRKQRRDIQFKRKHNFDNIIWQYLNSQEIKCLEK